MQPTRLTALAVVSLFTLFACGKEEVQQPSSRSGNALLSYVPTASPYLAANLEPTPNEVIDSFLQKAAPVLLTAQAELVKVRARLENAPDAADTGSKLALALLQELDGKLNRPGLESLGFDLQSHKVLYGMGAFPIVRIGLSDAKALKDTVQRILDHAGIPAPEQNFQGQAYWHLAADTPSGHYRAEVAGGLYIAILADHFALSVFPTTAESDLLPFFLGLQKPETSDAASRLKAVNALYGFTPYFTGLVDLQLLADEFLRPDSLLAGIMGTAGADSPATLGDACKNEFRQIISHTPRLVAGASELTPNAIGIQYIVETQPELAKQLASLVADVPMLDAVSARMLEFSFGMKFGPVRDFLREKVLAITQAPYQCERLQPLNASAADALIQLDKSMLPLVNNFRGLRLSVSRFSMTGSMPDVAEGLLAVHVEQPEMFVGMAQMFLPDLASLNLVKGDPPIQLPASLIPIPNIVAFAALSDDAIGVSFGAGEENGLLPYLAQQAKGDGTFMSLHYDTAAYLDFTQGMSEKWQAPPNGIDDAESAPGSRAEHEAVAREIAAAMQQAYKTVAGRSQLSLRFTAQGLVIDSRMTFK